MDNITFLPWPKTPRLYDPKGYCITEKLDGTNAAVIITDDGQVGAQSRKRLITPDADNHGFARWVEQNYETLIEVLGPGHHFGEWWGNGIQRGYGLKNGDKRFSLFNVDRFGFLEFDSPLPELGVVPKLYDGIWSDRAVASALENLRRDGSVAAPGFDKPEGICIFGRADRRIYKVILDKTPDAHVIDDTTALAA
ncbi:hypothetical protein FDA94_29040 [Herbidospora galbida]|uniref:RNA ligase domain-containing protein n=1 Tax=Herbidospora galbida TaxID=2575442 RepID=A0A4U3M8L7_9ACTN|nr:RNA ligase family protein [Herbidospora galbida]TKK84662.1 hypothetical protein FDA94_29040 [Herbidospora galbida]